MPFANDPIMLGRSIQLFRYLKCQNLSIISDSIDRGRCNNSGTEGRNGRAEQMGRMEGRNRRAEWKGRMEGRNGRVGWNETEYNALY